MSIANNYVSLKKAMKQYQDRLADYTDEAFAESPPLGGWSRAEVYAHITSANLLSLRAAIKAAKGNGDEIAVRVDWRVAVILFLGRLPKGRKLPKSLADTIIKISKTEAAERIQAVLTALDELYVLLPEASSTQKTKHPRLGYLNAPQWLRFIEIHSYHHLKQLDRINQALAVK